MQSENTKLGEQLFAKFKFEIFSKIIPNFFQIQFKINKKNLFSTLVLIPKKHILQIGKHSYNGNEVKMVPTLTMENGLCYRIHFSFPFKGNLKRKNFVKFEISFTCCS